MRQDPKVLSQWNINIANFTLVLWPSGKRYVQTLFNSGSTLGPRPMDDENETGSDLYDLADNIIKGREEIDDVS